MAQYRIGRSRRTNVPKPVYLEESTAAARAVGQILVKKHGQQPWIVQVMEAVQIAVNRGVGQLGNTQPPPANGQVLGQGGEYAFPARTAEELQTTQLQAAAQGETDPLVAFNNLHDPAAQLGGAPLVEVQPDLVLPDQTQIDPPAPLPAPKTEPQDDEWLM